MKRKLVLASFATVVAFIGSGSLRQGITTMHDIGRSFRLQRQTWSIRGHSWR